MKTLMNIPKPVWIAFILFGALNAASTMISETFNPKPVPVVVATKPKVERVVTDYEVAMYGCAHLDNLEDATVCAGLALEGRSGKAMGMYAATVEGATWDNIEKLKDEANALKLQGKL
jgi:hypothetical protein